MAPGKTTLTKTQTLLFEQVLLFQGIMPSVAASETLGKYLDMDLAQLMQVAVTSVTKKAQPLADTAAAVFVISQEDIRRSGVTSIPEALALAPGLHVARISAGKWSISARGFGGNLTGSWQHRFASDSLLTFKTYCDNNNRKESYYEQRFNTLDLDMQYEFALGTWNNLTTGLGYRHIDGDFVDSYQVHLSDQNQDLYSAFHEDQIRLIDRELWLTLGNHAGRAEPVKQRPIAIRC